MNALLLALGIGAMSFVSLVGEQVDRAVQRDLAGIDLVVGAKGSPLQLILAGVFHLDAPTGNIPLGTVEQLRQNPMVAQVVPLAMGDSLQGFRIVGSTADYLSLYGARLASGRLWQGPLEAVLGADVVRVTGLADGQSFAGTHGLALDGDPHGHTPYIVTGHLAHCGCVLDRLVLTDLSSVWAVHEVHRIDDDLKVDDDASRDRREVTLALVSYRTPLAAAMLPRRVNAMDGLQAAAPALESARLLRMVGVGTDVLRGVGLLLLLVAGLSVFIALYHAVREREPDLAMMRMLGAPPARLVALIATEALCLAAVGSTAGLLLGHGLAALLGAYLQADRSLSVTGAWWSLTTPALAALAAVLALAAAAIPAWRASRLDVTLLLQSPR